MKRPIHLPTLISLLVCGALVFIGAVRFMSYARSGPLAWAIHATPLRVLAYDPGNYLNAQFFKLLATPSVVAGQYFLFRLFNRGHNAPAVGLPPLPDRSIGFRSPWVRLALTSVVTAAWIPIEVVKANSPGFYPNSPLESAWINALVLLAGQAVAFFAMKHLSFHPLRRAG